MPPRALDARLAELERRAPLAPEPDSAADLARWFTYRELDVLIAAAHDDPERFERLAAQLLPRAQQRLAVGADMTAIDLAEREQRRLIRVPVPGDAVQGYYLDVERDPLEPSRWRTDDTWYRERHGRLWPLPAIMTEAEIEARCPFEKTDARCKCNSHDRRSTT